MSGATGVGWALYLPLEIALVAVAVRGGSAATHCGHVGGATIELHRSPRPWIDGSERAVRMRCLRPDSHLMDALRAVFQVLVFGH